MRELDEQRLAETGRRLVKHARFCWPILAESRPTRPLFEAMRRRIWSLLVPTGLRLGLYWREVWDLKG